MRDALTSLDGPPAGCAVRRTRHQDGATVLARAAEAFEIGRCAAWTPPAVDLSRTDPDREMRERFSAADRSALAALSEPRERALAEARRGDLAAATTSVRLAGFLLSLHRLSPQADAYARSLHQAAHSYVAFRQGDVQDARASMIAAIRWTDRLGEWWIASEFIAGRRIHLAHNLMKVEVAQGASDDAMQLGTQLVASVGAGALPGPTPHARATTAPLDRTIAEHQFNLVMETVAELVAALPADLARAYVASLGAHLSGVPPAWRGWKWHAMKTGAPTHEPHHVLAAAIPFLRDGRQGGAVLWYGASLDAAGACATVAREARRAETRRLARNTMRAIAAQLEAAPRVPAVMRRGASRLLATDPAVVHAPLVAASGA